MQPELITRLIAQSQVCLELWLVSQFSLKFKVYYLFQRIVIVINISAAIMCILVDFRSLIMLDSHANTKDSNIIDIHGLGHCSTYTVAADFQEAF